MNRPLITETPREFCKQFCCAWIPRRNKRGVDQSYCARLCWPPDENGERRCRWEWPRIKERMMRV